jgi:signal transduction histidine kinase
MEPSLSRLTCLILIPVVLLAGIAGFGLVEYRHAITAQARDQAKEWVQLADPFNAQLVARLEASPEVKQFQEIPVDGDGESTDAQELDQATASGDAAALNALVGSSRITDSGLPVSVLAAWRLFEMNNDHAAAERLAQLAIHEKPSAISEPILKTVIERFPEESAWLDQWLLSEEKRAILGRHPQESGFVTEATGPALMGERKVLTSSEVRDLLGEVQASVKRPSWMAIDIVALNTSLVSPIAEPFVKGGDPLTIGTGIADADALYTRYWRVVWWVASVIVCALITAIIGICLVRRTVERERKLADLKSQFVASVSHELRAPLASMRLMADALDAGKVNGQAAKDFHRLISLEGARLSALIENVLDFARIEEGRKRYQFEEADLGQLIVDTIQLMDPVAKERRVRIKREIRKLAHAPVVDAAAIQQALVNLLDNAIKFSPQGGTVRIHLIPAGRGWQLSVADDGPGVPKADRERVFERFSRLGNELRRETNGAGIGLSIVKHIVEAHGATISVNGSEPGGAEFVIQSDAHRHQEETDSGHAGVNDPRNVLRPCDS